MKKPDYRDEMRKLVILISTRAKEIYPGFAIIPQNAMELATQNGKPNGELVKEYFSSIDGAGCEELFYGHSGDGRKTDEETTSYYLDYLNVLKNNGRKILVIDYVVNKRQADDSHQKSNLHGFISFQANRELTNIPDYIYDKNSKNINKLPDAENFLYILNASRYRTPDTYFNALKNSFYDILVIDAFFHERLPEKRQMSLIVKKPGGQKRLVLAYLSIGEAEDYRFYWKPEWKKNPPSFLERENREWKGNYKVRYWMEEWKEIICGRSDGTGFEESYLKKIINAGFDGVYLDILDAAYCFERK